MLRDMEVVVEPQGEIDHSPGSGGDLCAAPASGKIMVDTAIVLLNRESEILAGEELIARDAMVETFPAVRYEGSAFDSDFVEKGSTGCIITPTQNPGKSSPLDRIIRSPKP